MLTDFINWGGHLKRDRARNILRRFNLCPLFARSVTDPGGRMVGAREKLQHTLLR